MVRTAIFISFLVLINFQVIAQNDTLVQDTTTAGNVLADTVLSRHMLADTIVKDTSVSQKLHKTELKKAPANDTIPVDSSRVYFYRYSLDSLSLENLQHIDTSLTGFQYYNPAFKQDHYFATLGNIGLAVNNLIYEPKDRLGFQYGLSAFDPFMFHIEDVRYFQLLKPYTHLKYVMGGKGEQFFRATHSQNPIQNINFGIDFRFIYSEGFYLHQLSDDKAFNGYVRYQTRNKRYAATITYLHDKISVEENGGLRNDSAFIRNEENDRMLYDVRLRHAENTIKKSGIQFNQYFHLSAPPQLLPDTAEEKTKGLNLNLGRISHRFYWERDQYLFTDSPADSNFYVHFGLRGDTANTHDSTYINKLINEFHWSNLSYGDKPADKAFYLKFGIKHQRIKIGYDSLGTNETTLNQLIPSGQLSFFIFNSFRLNAEYEFVIGDYNGGDFSLRGYVNQYIGTKEKNKGLIRIKANYSHITPGWFYHKRDTNYFSWQTNFDKQQYLTGNISYSYKNFRAGVQYNLITHYTYLNEKALPQQFGESFGVIQAFLKKGFRIWNLGIDNTLIYQTSSRNDILHIPEFIAHINIHYTQQLFRGATTIHPGIDFFYNTAYYADAYMPALKSFYLQDNIQLGNYPFMDVYVTIKIKRARIFFKYAHVNSGWMGYDYFMVPHYPQKDANFKLGISWMFYD